MAIPVSSHDDSIPKIRINYSAKKKQTRILQ